MGCEVVIVPFSSVRFSSAWNLFIIGISPRQFFFGCILISFRVRAVVTFLAFRVIFLFLACFCIFHRSLALLFASVCMYEVSVS